MAILSNKKVNLSKLLVITETLIISSTILGFELNKIHCHKADGSKSIGRIVNLQTKEVHKFKSDHH